MHERALLEHIAHRARALHGAGGVIVGPGDDCAVVSVGGRPTLLTTDHLIEGRHYEPGTAVERIAWKALARSVSDIAAMGGQPRFALATALLPADWPLADRLFDAMHACALELGCPLVGGDLASWGPGWEGDVVLTTMVLGEPSAARGPVLRSQASVGQGVFVTGRIGASLASGHHMVFVPRVREAQWLCQTLGERLGAMIDVSDGLGVDAGRIASMSGVGVELDAGLIPLRDVGVPARRAIADGEDYELLFTADARAMAALLTAGMPSGLASVTQIGRVVPASQSEARAVLIEGHARTDVGRAGWEH